MNEYGFIPIETNEYKFTAKLNLEESMSCDCCYYPGLHGNLTKERDNISKACGEDSNCINRTLLMECSPKSCPCRSSCQNQRFHRNIMTDFKSANMLTLQLSML